MATVVSAPGKVLIAGGYVVLERPNAGLVVAVDARVQSSVETVEDGGTAESVDVRLESPQYGYAAEYRFTPGSVPVLEQTDEEQKPNAFVESVLKHTLAVVHARALGAFAAARKLRVIVQGNNNFYSQRDQLERLGKEVTSTTLAELPPFLPFLDPSDQAKTGLGSSAALVSSLVGALLHHFGLVRLAPLDRSSPAPAAGSQAEKDLAYVHNLSQITHCLAQGKIGSGFDVASGVYGSARYVRFSPTVIRSVLDGPGTTEELLACVERASSATDAWDQDIRPFTLPDGMSIVVGDVNSGASTPSMVSRVLAWKRDHAGAADTWTELCAGHERVGALLLRLVDAWHADGAAFRGALEATCDAGEKAWDGEESGDATRKLLCDIRSSYLALRALVRRVGAEADVPIEPATLTPVLDRTMQVPGVLMAGCPGAGGEDAIFAIVLRPSAALEVEHVWRTESANMCALDVHAESSGHGIGLVGGGE